ncbi:protein SMALL AUXIN UP-REGULATED RNA 12-like [Cryptomeria japonica]|uniref:protein SMALL AUXIN UP-REGULATED RNA 12-like n=1 Tax=Cryptomeria japonica TaxID=3369 RepID=UPI0025AD2917|nr:protein SMALL AUXIN UP-REGULATED RNA 12-like [Cryptomeria japonica]
MRRVNTICSFLCHLRFIVLKKLQKCDLALRRPLKSLCDSNCDISEEEWQIPFDVPDEHLAVYAGNERRRFVVKACYLNHPLFRVLLDKAEEEFGFDQKGGLTLPCDPKVIQGLLLLLHKNENSFTASEVEFERLLLS